VAIGSTTLSFPALAQSEASDVYIQQSHGRVAPGAKVDKPPPEATTTAAPVPAQTAPITCNAQNASSSQACYTATQQSRPATR
jgi:hypothetical protein